jgi:hypothetical protein
MLGDIGHLEKAVPRQIKPPPAAAARDFKSTSKPRQPFSQEPDTPVGLHVYFSRHSFVPGRPEVRRS